MYRFSTHTRKMTIKLLEGETVTGAVFCTDEDIVIMAASNGLVLPLRVNDILQRKNVSQAVIGMKIDDGAECIGVTRCKDKIAVILNDVKGELTHSAGVFPDGDISKTYARGSKGKMAAKTEGDVRLALLAVASDSDCLYLASDEGRLLRLRVENVPEFRRLSAGNKLMKLKAGGRVCCGAFNMTSNL